MFEMSESSESLFDDVVSEIRQLSNAELDQQLEDAAITSEKAEMLVCCYLCAVSDRRAYKDFGYTSISDYAQARFGFADRKTRYLVSIGRKIDHLPKIRAALVSGKLGWCKASRLASVAAPDNEVMWLESALSLTVRQLEQRIKDGTDTLTSVLRLPLTEDRRILWENALEIFRRRAGAEISPVEAFELMVAEVIAEWAHYLTDTETSETPETPLTPETPETPRAKPRCLPTRRPRSRRAPEAGPVFPWVEQSNWPLAQLPAVKRPSPFDGLREAREKPKRSRRSGRGCDNNSWISRSAASRSFPMQRALVDGDSFEMQKHGSAIATSSIGSTLENMLSDRIRRVQALAQ